MRGRIGASIAIVSLGALCVLGATLGWQHRQPSAIAQVSRALGQRPGPLTVVSTGLVNDVLRGTGVRARFLAVEQGGVADSLRSTPQSGRVVSVGDYRDSIPMRATDRTRFYHNPHVNRIWPLIELYEYAPNEVAR